MGQETTGRISFYHPFRISTERAIIPSQAVQSRFANFLASPLAHIAIHPL